MILLHTDGTHETVTIRGTATVCRVDGCDRPRNGRSTLCGSHRAQNHRTGKYALPRPSIEERFWAKVASFKSGWCIEGRCGDCRYASCGCDCHSEVAA